MSDTAEAYLAHRRGHFINGAWAAPQSAAWIKDYDPGTGETIGEFADGNADDIDLAVAAARRAFENEAWANMPPRTRGELLWRFADAIEADGETLALFDFRDVGRSRHHILNNEAPSAAGVFRYYAGWCSKIPGRVAAPTTGGDQTAFVSKHPVGVAGLIIPWNFPLLGTSWKLAPALAAGCAVIMKPSEESPLTALRLSELSKQAGFPDGVVNVVTGRGATAGAALAAHPDVDKIAFTGSTETGRAILTAAGGNLKRVSLELGGKSPVVVLDDADIDKAAGSSALGAFYNAGQICAAGTRIYVHEHIFDAFLATFKNVATSLPMGHGDDPNAVIGPMISCAARARVHSYVERAVKDGARLVAGGEIPEGPGAFYPPTILADVPDSASVNCDELFGPVVTIAPFKSVSEAIARANNTIYGLTAKIWTRNIDAAHYLATRIKAGTIEINGSGGPDANLPFGGIKQSGWGRELGPEGLDQFLETRTTRLWHDFSAF